MKAFYILSFICFVAGNYYCAVEKKDSRRIPQFLSTLDTAVDLHVTVHRGSGQTEVRSAELSIPFYPGFFVHQAEFTLSSVQRKTELFVEGVESVLKSLQVRKQALSVKGWLENRPQGTVAS